MIFVIHLRMGRFSYIHANITIYLSLFVWHLCMHVRDGGGHNSPKFTTDLIIFTSPYLHIVLVTWFQS